MTIPNIPTAQPKSPPWTATDNVAPQLAAIGDNGAYAVAWQGTDEDGDDSIFVQLLGN